MSMTEWRSRLRAFGRRRLLRLRDRIDSRLKRLEEKRATFVESRAAEEETPPAPRRRPARRRTRQARRTAAPPVEGQTT